MLNKRLDKELNEHIRSYLVSVKAKADFLLSCGKICPKCGAVLHISDKGCNNCLFQFNQGGKKKYVRRLG